MIDHKLFDEFFFKHHQIIYFGEVRLGTFSLTILTMSHSGEIIDNFIVAGSGEVHFDFEALAFLLFAKKYLPGLILFILALLQRRVAGNLKQ